LAATAKTHVGIQKNDGPHLYTFGMKYEKKLEKEYGLGAGHLVTSACQTDGQSSPKKLDPYQWSAIHRS